MSNPQLLYVTNNAYDAVLLVVDGMVRSDWTVDRDVFKDFCDCSQDAGDWDDRQGDEFVPSDYGDLVAVRDGYEMRIVDNDEWVNRLRKHLGVAV